MNKYQRRFTFRPSNTGSIEVVYFGFSAPSHTTVTIEALLHATNLKLELPLPPIAPVQARAPDAYSSWSAGYNSHYAKGGMPSDKLPSSISFSQSQQAQHSSSPRGLASSILNGSSSYPKKDTLPTPTTSQNGSAPQYSTSNQFAYGTENNTNSYMNSQPSTSYGALDYSQHHQHHQHHMSQGQPPAPQTATSGGGMGGYSQPPLLQPSYQSNHGFPSYPFPSPGGVTSPAGPPGSMVHPSQSMLPLPPSTTLNTAHPPLNSVSQGSPATPQSGTGGQYPSTHTFDATGQIAPPGMKPRVAATLWEDEGSLCFQVEARGVCVARREGKNLAACQVLFLPYSRLT